VKIASFNSDYVRNITLRVHFADLATMPGGPHPIPSRTRSLSPPGPMVLRLKARESRSLPGLRSALSDIMLKQSLPFQIMSDQTFLCMFICCLNGFIAGWSSPVARQAHNLKVVGSNPAPAPKVIVDSLAFAGLFRIWGGSGHRERLGRCAILWALSFASYMV
jgi:hypothetical protein